MGRDVIPSPGEDLAEYGPAMQVLTQLERNFVNAYVEHPNYNGKQLVALAGYSTNSDNAMKVTAHRLMHSERVLAAMNEEAAKRLRTGGLIGVNGIIAVALNPSHKDHLKACAMLADRTGFHALSEHKVTVDDKRPQTKQELIAAIRNVAKEAGLDDTAIKALTGEDVVDAEYVDVTDVDQDIARQMEDL